jgi:DNA-binding IclR family transcriptional regulator
MPLLAGATGRVFLAQLEEKKAKDLVQKKGLTRYTPKSVTDVKRFFKDMEETRKRGYAIDHEEYLLGVTAVAAPIQTTSLPPAAIWVVMFTPGSYDQKIEKVVQEIQKAAQEVSRLLKDRLG